MNKEKSLTQNYIFNLIKTLNSILFPIITFSYSAHVLGVGGVGKVNFVKSVITYFTMIATLGMNYYGTREAAKLRSDQAKLCKFCIEMLVINSIATLLAYCLLIVTMFSIPMLHEYTVLLLISSTAIILQGLGMEWLYQAMEEYRYIAVRSVLFQIVALIALVLFVRNENDIVPYTVITLIASSGSYILNFVNARKYIRLRYYGCLEIRKHMKPLLWLFAMAVSIELYTVLDTTMLGVLKGDATVGLYTAAIKVERMANTVITSIGVVLIPRLSFYIGQMEQEKVQVLVNKAYNYVFMLSFPAAIGLFLLSDEIIKLFSGSAFVSASLTMRILVPIVIVIPFSVVTNQQTFIPMGKEKLILISTFVGAGTNFILNLILIPLFAENGAAIATVIAEAAVAMVCFLNVRKYFDIKVICRFVWQYWVAGISILIVVVLIRQMELGYVIHVLLTISIAFVLYFLILLLMKNPYVNDLARVIEEKIQKRRGRA